MGLVCQPRGVPSPARGVFLILPTLSETSCIPWRLLRAHSAHPLLIGPSWTRFLNMFLRFGFWYFKTKKSILLRKNVKFFRGSAPRPRAYAVGVGASPQTPRLQRAAAPRGTSAASRQRQRKRCDEQLKTGVGGAF